MKKCMVITAAGMSTRQKRNKLLIRSCHETMIEKTVSTLLGLDLDIFVIVGHEAKQIVPILEHRFGNDIEIVYNKDYKTGIASSIKSGVLAAGDRYDYYGFCNGDKPYIKSTSVKELIDYIDKNNPEILIPLYQDEAGHPTFFNKIFIKDLKEIKGDIGGKDVIEKHPKSITYLPIDDEGIILDMDKYLEN